VSLKGTRVLLHHSTVLFVKVWTPYTITKEFLFSMDYINFSSAPQHMQSWKNLKHLATVVVTVPGFGFLINCNYCWTNYKFCNQANHICKSLTKLTHYFCLNMSKNCQNINVRVHFSKFFQGSGACLQTPLERHVNPLSTNVRPIICMTWHNVRPLQNSYNCLLVYLNSFGPGCIQITNKCG